MDTTTRRGPALAAAIVAIGVLVGLMAPVAAQIYRWTDERGDVRFSQGIQSVPPQFRGVAVAVGAADSPAPAGPSTGEASSDAAPSGVARIQFTPGRPIMVNARINGSGTTQLILD